MLHRREIKRTSRNIDHYVEEVKIRNFNSFQGFAVVGMIISLLVNVFGLILSDIKPFQMEFLVIFGYFVLLVFISRFLLYKCIEHITFMFYLALTPLMLIGIFLGTFLDPKEPSITIMVFLCVLTIFIIDKPWRLVLYITGTALVYMICCYLAKDQEHYLIDMIHLLAYYLLAVGVNFFTLQNRIDSVENYVKYRNRSEIDQLTGVCNRGTGVAKIEQLMKDGMYGAFIVIDVDDFKVINDRFGHMWGDQCLKELSQQIKSCFREEDIILRLGGDEFVIYAVGMTQRKQCAERLDRLYEEVHSINILPEKEYMVSISLGCVICNDEIEEFDEIYQLSDKYMYQAKNSGKDHYEIIEYKKYKALQTG